MPNAPWLQPPIVVKVGGSLFDWPDLTPRLRDYLATLAGKNVLLIPGGGPAAPALIATAAGLLPAAIGVPGVLVATAIGVRECDTKLAT